MKSFVTRIICEPTDTGFLAFSPDVDGVFATAPTMLQASRRLRLALKAHLHANWHGSSSRFPHVSPEDLPGQAEVVTSVFWPASKVVRYARPKDKRAIAQGVVQISRRGKLKRRHAPKRATVEA